MSKTILKLGVLLVLLFSQLGNAVEKDYLCGISDGFPPYQFKNAQGEVSGFDADVLRLISSEAAKNFSFYQMNWDSVVSNLLHTSKLDCAAGMEITDIREELFDFSMPYYSRRIAVFILSENVQIKSVSDLIGKIVAGDRHSSLEKQLELEGVKGQIRLRQTGSKEESMGLLKTGEVLAMIAPKEVGLYLAGKLAVNVKIIEESKLGSAVGIAVKKGDGRTQGVINRALTKLIQNGEIERLYQKWFE